jgi:nucleoside diphosphate kinase
MADATERTYIMIKPDGVQRGIVGEVLRRFEQRGYKLVGLKMLTVGEQIVRSIDCSFVVFTASTSSVGKPL